MSDLSTKQCKPCEGGVSALTDEEADAMLIGLDGWIREENTIRKPCTFRNYYETIAFVNAVAYLAHHEDHHPEMLVGYKTCTVSYTTHAIGGLSENDFICAAKLNALSKS